MNDNQQARMYVDAHCHVDLFAAPENVVQEAEREGIYTIAVTNAPSVFSHTANLVANSRFLRAAIGLHPELVHSHGHELPMVREHLKTTRYVGEIGLDYTTPDNNLRAKQRTVLSTIAGWATEYRDRVLTIHSRRAAGDVITVLKGFEGKKILHWFSGTKKELDLAVNEDFYFSINTAMLRSERGSALISRMPPDRIITETDGPFIKELNLPTSPIHARLAVAELASVWGKSADEARSIVLKNFRQIVSEDLK